MLDTGVHVPHMWGAVWRFWCYNSWGTLRLSCWGQWWGFQTLPVMWEGTGGVQPGKERRLVKGIWARPLLGGLRRTETSSGSLRGENKHAGGGCVWGDLSSLDGRTVHQSPGSRSEQAASEGGGLLPSKRLSQSGMNWSLSWVMISKEPFSRHTHWESLKPLKMLRGGNSLAVQGLGFCVFTARDTGSVPVWGTQISQALQHGPPTTTHVQKKKKKRVPRGHRPADGASQDSPSMVVCSQTGSLHSPALFRSGRNPRTWTQ